ncbi:MAG: type I-B CRISPR-associated protein Cas5b [Bacilli bacterium]|nr:type I-B CRISPR-associated protein Cas5b [Bacilli bacterium]
MINEKLISFDLKSDFAFFKKPDYNVGIQLSYNMLHKPALLGILGAIIGLEGYKENEKPPKYFEKLKHLQIGIMPLNHENGNYQKTVLRYTNGIGYANKDGNLLVDETMLITPSYRCFLLLDIEQVLEKKLYSYILAQQAEYIPYLGKNEFQAWIEEPMEYSYKPLTVDASFSIDSLFVKSGIVKEQIVAPEISFDFSLIGGSFTYFERLPIGFNEELMQYEMAEFALTDWKMKPESRTPNLYSISNEFHPILNVQLF